MNKVCLTGRITKDPEIRYTQQSGTAQVSFSIAVDRQTKDANGNRQADFINCVAWRNQAEFISKYVRKGQMLAVDGRIQTRNYQGQDGQTHYVTEILVDSVENLSPRDPNQTPATNYGAGQQMPNNNYQGYGSNNGYQQPNNYQPNQFQNNQGYNNPTSSQAQSTKAPEAPKSFGVDVADDDLPF
jgi:single-strand DNA-binding protein